MKGPGSCFTARTALVLVATILVCFTVFHSLVHLQVFEAKYSDHSDDSIKILSLNTWGMPARLGGKFKPERIDAIAKEIRKGKYDIYLLQELWMSQDHYNIASNIPQGYTITGFRQLSSPSCDGQVLPTYCSGLAIV